MKRKHLPITVLFDVDDTLVDTQTDLAVRLKADYGLDYPEDPFNAEDPHRAAIDTLVGQGTFMRTAALHPEFLTLPAVMAQYKQTYGAEFGLCTNRGFHRYAKALTRDALTPHGFTFDWEFYLNSAEQPCKIEFLNLTLGKGRWILVCDNPTKHTHKFLPRNVILVKQPWNAGLFLTEPAQRVPRDRVLERLEWCFKQIYS